MTENDTTLSTAQFSERSGLSVSTVAKMLREGKLRGEKRGGRWAIFASELDNRKEAAGSATTAAPSPAAVSSTPAAAGESYPIDVFVRMTYLTEKGVRRFLSAGRLTGGVDDQGRVVVDAANLKRPELKHLIRE